MSMLLKAAMGGSPPTTYVDDVFSAYTYTGTGSALTITNGIDLSGKGGLVWSKTRSAGSNVHLLCDTVRGAEKFLISNATNAEDSAATDGLTAFSSTGYTLGADAYWQALNVSTSTYVSWTFAKAAKFFDVQQVTKSAGSDATVSLSPLGTVGMVAVKRTDSTGDWFVYHRSCTAGKLVYLNKTNAEATLGEITLSGTTLTLEDGVIADGTYIIYAWAHDTGADGLIQCGTFTTAADAFGTASVTLGFETQYIIFKKVSGTEDWFVFDTARGMNASSADTGAGKLAPNTFAEEIQYSRVSINATGFTVANFGGSSSKYIYLAIRRPNKPPTAGTQVYNGIARTGTGAAAVETGVGFTPDLAVIKARAVTEDSAFWNRLCGNNKYLSSSTTDAEATYGVDVFAFAMDGINYAGTGKNTNARTYIDYFFRRAPGVFDEVCWTGTATGSPTTHAHNLGVAPGLYIVKKRSAASNWNVLVYSLGANKRLYLDRDVVPDTDVNIFGNTLPTASVFTYANDDTETFVAYLFATKAGISKVGSYTGNGSNLTLNMGFAAGARFFMCKRTDDTGDWFIWDSTRGIVAGNDPHLSLNSSAAEVTNDDSVDPDNSGIIVNEIAATHINVNGASYIYLSFS